MSSIMRVTVLRHYFGEHAHRKDGLLFSKKIR